MYKTIVILTDEQPYEYYCEACDQLRLAFGDTDTCMNCGSRRIVKGAVGTLDKDKLRKGEK